MCVTYLKAARRRSGNVRDGCVSESAVDPNALHIASALLAFSVSSAGSASSMGDGSTIRQCLPVSCRQSPRRIGRRDDTLLCAIQVHQGGIGTVTGTIFTKQGRPLRRSGDDLFARSGERE